MTRESQMGPQKIGSDMLRRFRESTWLQGPSPFRQDQRLRFQSWLKGSRRRTEQLEKRWRVTAQAARVGLKLEAGGKDEDRARWLLDFAAVDLDSLSEGDWLNLRQSAENFVASPGFTSTRKVSARTLKAGLRELQKWIVTGLTSLVAKGTWTLTTKAPIVLGVTPLGLTNIVSHGDAISFGEAFKTTAYEVLINTASRFRLCLECGRPFIAGKGQEYCTSRCSQAARTRRFISRHPGLAATGRKDK
jgi:hypothetical protein